MRENLRSKFLQLIKKAGDYYEALNQWEQAAIMYKKSLEVDTLADQFHQRLMLCSRQ